METTRTRTRATAWPAVPSLAGVCFVLLTACATAPVPAGPPAAPQDVTAVPGPGYVVVSWDHDGVDLSSFLVERSAGAAGTVARFAVAASAIEEFDGAARSFVDLDVEPGVAYGYMVTAVGPEGPSEAVAPGDGTVTIATGVDLMVGTNDRRYDDGTGTIFVVYYVFPRWLQDDPAVTYFVTIEGPPGWNGGDTITFSLAAGGTSRSYGWGFLSRNTVDAVAGTYVATVEVESPAGTEVYSAETELLHPDFQLGAPTDMAVSVGPDTVQATWTPPAGTLSHIVSLWRGTYETIVTAYGFIGATSTHTFTGLALDDALHQVEIAPANVDFTTYPIRVEPFGLSYDARPFVVGDAVSPLCGGADQEVDVADAALEAAVRAATGTTAGPLTCSDLAVLTSVEVPDAGIAPLAQNLAFADAYVRVDRNLLDLTDEAVMDDVEALIARGVDLVYAPQRTE